MSGCKRILLAVDFSQDSEFIGRRAIELAEKFGAEIFLIHVVVDLKSHLFQRLIMSSLSDDVQEQMTDSARKQLREFAQQLNVPDAKCLVELGPPRKGILKAVKEQEIDLIVVGNHGVGGADLLLGSTADTILHKSPVDVFVVRLPG